METLATPHAMQAWADAERRAHRALRQRPREVAEGDRVHLAFDPA